MLTSENRYHLSKFGQYWNGDHFVTRADVAELKPEPAPALACTRPEAAWAFEYQQIFGADQDAEPAPDPVPKPEPEAISELSLIRRTLHLLTNLVVKQGSREAPLIEVKPEITVVVPENPVALSVELPEWERTDVIERDDEGWIKSVKRISGPAPDPSATTQPDRAKVTDLVRDRMGLQPK